MEAGSRFLSGSVGTWTFTELGSIILRQWQRNSGSELSGTYARDGNSQRRVAESTKRRTTEEHLEQETGSWHIADLVTMWTLGDGVKAKVRDHTSKTGFTEEPWCWRRARKSMKKTDPENREKSSGSHTGEL